MSEKNKWDLEDDVPSPENKSNKPLKKIGVDEIHPDTGQINGPLVMFVGPSEVGKTVVLLRLANYLMNNQNITLSVNPDFRTDDGYSEVVKTFQESIMNIRTSPTRTGSINFLLLDVIKNQSPFCQILEAPGEHFFSSDDPTKSGFRLYMDSIINATNNKKIVVFFFEPAMLKTPEMRAHYSNRLKEIINRLDLNKDRIIILYNKVDREGSLIRDGRVNRQAVKDKIFDNPSYLVFKNTLLSNKNLKQVEFIPFSSGSFYDREGSKEQSWALGNEKYPKELWGQISECIKKKGWSFF